MTARRVVVAGAIVADRRLLLAQRGYPAEVDGLWELPGGKAELGESPESALRRELREELGVEVRVGTALRESVALRHDLVLVALRAYIEDGSPRAVEHRALRWVDADELRSLHAEGSLVPADTAWVPELLVDLARRPGPS
ncbi:NUDIX domain-containing protein [Gordonia sp. PKS22-38]|uniref:8-oxo-dGTP diphosphatase n=1 Tax=Gordonia prachuapensis TaxID=3115651 RepID=A0ABU7MWY1_9ACTN|nr:NUDIX domain-containing protein [Gordonia sp. PKS22-38]